MTAVLSMVIVVLIGVRLRPRPERVIELVGRRPPRSASHPTFRSERPIRRRTQVDPADVARWCRDLAAACRAGETLAAAIRSCPSPATAHEPIDTLVLALDRGVPLAEAAADIATDVAHLDLALMVVRACAVTGGSPAEPLDRAAAALRGRAAEAAERRTQSAQARLSAVVMTVLPAAMLGLLLLTSGSVRNATTTPVGAICLVIGAVLNLLGWHWMRRLVDGAGR